MILLDLRLHYSYASDLEEHEGSNSILDSFGARDEMFVLQKL
jgi:hypothetical protein